MLDAMRRASKSWVMKAILAVLALTFVAFFGSSNFGGRSGRLLGGNVNSVVEVGDVDFTVQQVSRAYNAQLQQISRATGRQIDSQSPIATAILNQAIGTMVSGALYDVAAQDLGVVASDAAVEDAIRRVPAFRGPDGKFDQALFTGYLRQAGLTPSEFISKAREDLQRTQYLGTLRAGITAPDPLVQALYKYRGERRIAELVTISASTVEGLKPPDEAQLGKYYEENRNSFEAPEYRAATVAMLSIDKLAAKTDVPDKEVADYYASHLALYQTPEQREVLEGIFLDKAAADKAAAKIHEGQSFADAIKEGTGLTPVPGTVDKARFSSPKDAETVFKAKVGEVVGPVETPLGWELLSIVSTKPEYTRPLAEVTDEIRHAIALRRAHDAVYKLLAKVEDDLAAGNTLEDVAHDNGLTVDKLEPFSSAGLMHDGKTITIEPTAKIVGAAFATAKGEQSDVIDTPDGGFFIVRVDSITPPQIEPLERIHDQVVTAWLDNERRNRAITRANDLAERARAGGSLEQLAKEFGGKFEKTPPFDRTGKGATIAAPLIGPIFKAKKDEVVQAQVQNGAAVARLVDIQSVTGTDKAAEKSLRTQLADSINQDLAQQLTAALRARYSIDIDRETIEQALLSR